MAGTSPAMTAWNLPISSSAFLRLGGVPQRVHLGQRRLLRRFAARGQGALDGGEPEIADLAGEFFRRALVERGLDLVRLFSNLRQHRARIVPVEPDLAGLLLQLEGAGERGEGDRHARERAGSAARTF